MSNMPVIPSKDFLRLLLKYGCIELRSKGSHFRIENLENGCRATIPVHGKRDIGDALSKAILVQLGIDVNKFIEFIRNS